MPSCDVTSGDAALLGVHDAMVSSTICHYKTRFPTIIGRLTSCYAFTVDHAHSNLTWRQWTLLWFTSGVDWLATILVNGTLGPLQIALNAKQQPLGIGSVGSVTLRSLEETSLPSGAPIEVGRCPVLDISPLTTPQNMCHSLLTEALYCSSSISVYADAQSMRNVLLLTVTICLFWIFACFGYNQRRTSSHCQESLTHGGEDSLLAFWSSQMHIHYVEQFVTSLDEEERVVDSSWESVEESATEIDSHLSDLITAEESKGNAARDSVDMDTPSFDSGTESIDTPSTLSNSEDSVLLGLLNSSSSKLLSQGYSSSLSSVSIPPSALITPPEPSSGTVGPRHPAGLLSFQKNQSHDISTTSSSGLSSQAPEFQPLGSPWLQRSSRSYQPLIAVQPPTARSGFTRPRLLSQPLPPPPPPFAQRGHAIYHSRDEWHPNTIVVENEVGGVNFFSLDARGGMGAGLTRPPEAHSDRRAPFLPVCASDVPRPPLPHAYGAAYRGVPLAQGMNGPAPFAPHPPSRATVRVQGPPNGFHRDPSPKRPILPPPIRRPISIRPPNT